MFRVPHKQQCLTAESHRKRGELPCGAGDGTQESHAEASKGLGLRDRGGSQLYPWLTVEMGKFSGNTGKGFSGVGEREQWDVKCGFDCGPAREEGVEDLVFTKSWWEVASTVVKDGQEGNGLIGGWIEPRRDCVYYETESGRR